MEAETPEEIRQRIREMKRVIEYYKEQIKMLEAYLDMERSLG